MKTKIVFIASFLMIMPAAFAVPVPVPQTENGSEQSGGEQPVPQSCNQLTQHQNQLPAADASETDLNAYRQREQILTDACNRDKSQQANAEEQQRRDGQSLEERIAAEVGPGSKNEQCTQILRMSAEMPQEPKIPAVYECEQLKAISQGLEISEPFDSDITVANTAKSSVDGQITCKATSSYTIDYGPCKKALFYYDAVIMAEKAMDLQQKVRTDLKGTNLQREAQQRAAQGDVQGAALDGQSEMQNHMRSMNREKLYTYLTATAALAKAWWSIPGEKGAREKCRETGIDVGSCEQTVNSNRRKLIANEDAKAQLQVANAAFAAKATAAKLAMNQNDQNIDTIDKVKGEFETEEDDLMMERCQFNPADPACLEKGDRVSVGKPIGVGDFSLGGEGGNNAFNLNPEGSEFGEVGAETSLSDKDEVASINNPFADDAKIASDILNPAGAAEIQATGGAGSGAPGGGAAGGGSGGGASLGNDLAAENKDGDNEPKIKTGKVSGIYGAAGGGGYKGVSKRKEDKNPFANLFNQKSAGGVVEDRSIASEGIDGKASGLFQKISKRYTQMHADKRIEANNLE